MAKHSRLDKVANQSIRVQNGPKWPIHLFVTILGSFGLFQAKINTSIKTTLPKDHFGFSCQKNYFLPEKDQRVQWTQNGPKSSTRGMLAIVKLSNIITIIALKIPSTRQIQYSL